MMFTVKSIKHIVRGRFYYKKPCYKDIDFNYPAGREKLGVGVTENVRAVLETDGTQVDDSEYFRSLPDNTVFLLLRPGERWCPAGVDVIRAG